MPYGKVSISIYRCTLVVATVCVLIQLIISMGVRSGNVRVIVRSLVGIASFVPRMLVLWG